METTESIQNGTTPGNDKRFVRKPRKNQLIYVEYEQPTDSGHKITVMDSYRNVLGRIHERYDEQKDKMEYSFQDSNGNQLFKSENVEQLKEEISRQKGVMMEQAHQRRIEKNAEKEISQTNPFKKEKPGKTKSVPTVKEIEGMVARTNKEAREVTQTVHDFVGGEETPREKELRKLRQQKGHDREQEISR